MCKKCCLYELEKIKKLKNEISKQKDISEYNEYVNSLCQRKNCSINGKDIRKLYDNLDEYLKDIFWENFFECKLYEKIDKNSNVYVEMKKSRQYEEIAFKKLFCSNCHSKLKINLSDREYSTIVAKYLKSDQIKDIGVK